MLEFLRSRPCSKVVVPGPSAKSFAFSEKMATRTFGSAERQMALADAAEREDILTGFASMKDGLPLALEWEKYNPLSPYSNLCLGSSLMLRAVKEAREAMATTDATREAVAASFSESFRKARNAFKRAALRDDKLPDPYAWMIQAGLFQRMSKEDYYKLYSSAVSRDYLNWPAHRYYFLTTTERMGGSRKEMSAFLKEAISHTPEGSPIHILTASSYNELFFSASAQSGLNAAGKLMRRKEYADAVRNALEFWLAGPPENLKSPLPGPDDATRFHGANQFAVALYVTGALEEARVAVSALQGKIESSPWAWLAGNARERTDPAFVYDRVCRELDIDPRQYSR